MFCLCLCSLLDVLQFWKREKNASDEIIWRTPCSTSADPLGVADPRLKTSGLQYCACCYCTEMQWLFGGVSQSVYSIVRVVTALRCSGCLAEFLSQSTVLCVLLLH